MQTPRAATGAATHISPAGQAAAVGAAPQSSNPAPPGAPPPPPPPAAPPPRPHVVWHVAARSPNTRQHTSPVAQSARFVHDSVIPAAHVPPRAMQADVTPMPPTCTQHSSVAPHVVLPHTIGGSRGVPPAASAVSEPESRPVPLGEPPESIRPPSAIPVISGPDVPPEVLEEEEPDPPKPELDEAPGPPPVLPLPESVEMVPGPGLVISPKSRELRPPQPRRKTMGSDTKHAVFMGLRLQSTQ